ncbi:transposase [Agrobacterium vitis]|nr:transposase [Agrobacterium vitis]MBE1436279.1 transposase [Agrobacterium vitis]
MGVLDRLILRDDQWDQIARHIIGDARTRCSSGLDNRMFVEAVLWIVRTGSPWRGLPEVFGDWNSVFRRFSRWSQKGIWWRVFDAMSDDRDFEYLIIDSTIICVHQHAYTQRHLVECCFSKLKQCRRIATRYEKTARNYRAMIALAATILWLK